MYTILEGSVCWKVVHMLQITVCRIGDIGGLQLEAQALELWEEAAHVQP